ncbi:MAG: cyclic nucleotide-binding domain-containing protein [Acidiferrobacteraceae bacterium]|jgi:CRP/FNR family cyclic AMP-dependent transcriptional regulator
MADLYTRILMLSKAPVFSSVNTEDLRVLALELEEEACFAGERVFDISEPSDRVYIIESGKIGISINPDPKAKEFIATLGPNECFGEMGIFDDNPRSATAHVLEDSTLLVLDKAKLRALVLNYPEMALGMLRSLSLRLREANRKL